MHLWTKDNTQHKVEVNIGDDDQSTYGPWQYSDHWALYFTSTWQGQNMVPFPKGQNTRQNQIF